MAGELPHDHGGQLCATLAKMPEEEAFSDAADIFSQLADPSRLRILYLLCHSEDCVTNIAAAVGMSDPAVSHHLRILKKAGVLQSRRLGKEVHYTLADSDYAKLVHRMIDDVFRINCQ